MVDASLVTAVASAVLAAAALLFAIVQAITAFSQYLASMNRCARSVTGAFDLRQGIWLYSNTLTLNPRYRMPVLTMPGLRKEMPVMEQGQCFSHDLNPGTNFSPSLNGYVDAHKPRILGSGKTERSLPIAKRKTLLSILLRVFLAPFALAFSLACAPLFVPCDLYYIYERIKEGKEYDEGDDCGGFGTGDCIRLPFCPVLVLFDLPIQRKAEGDDIELPLSPRFPRSETPALEAASWAQFLMCYQAAWWGSGSIRWEWRLASMIPADTYGASAETTVADLELLGIMGGMHFLDDSRVLAKTKCGEQLTYSEHNTLGRIASYRSGRENIQPGIFMDKPSTNLPWLYYCIEARRLSNPESFQSYTKYKGGQVDVHYSNKKLATHLTTICIGGAIEQLARRRTQYDAQLQFSCENAMWVLSTQGFIDASEWLHDDSEDWSKVKCLVFWGALGTGINGCSCIQCCREWFNAQNFKDKDLSSSSCFWPALELNLNPLYLSSKSRRPIVGPCSSLTPHQLSEVQNSGLMREISIMVRKQCNGHCTGDQCSCGHIARLEQTTRKVEPPLDECLAVTAWNTAWLRKVRHDTLLQASEEILLKPLGGRTRSQSNVLLRNVLSYTELLLPKIRHHIGSTNIWDCPRRPSLTDFSPIVLGA